MATSTTATTAAQRSGFSYQGHGPSSGSGVRPITRFLSSSSGFGLVHLVSPPPPQARVALFDLHADVWWGALMALTGGFYCVKYRPDRKQA